MGMDDQREVIAFLNSPETHGGAPVERVDTHASLVFLAGSRALKLKRAVSFDYLDFSTVERRRQFCEAEVRINGRTAPSVYRDVIAVTRQPDGRLALGGAGSAVEWLVDMTRFNQDRLFDRLAARGDLALDLMAPLGAEIARFHAAAARRHDHGGHAGMAWVIDGNARDLQTRGAGLVDPVSCVRLATKSRAVLERVGRELDARRDTGVVRQCHGDLHLRNVVLLDGSPTLFDAIEFSDELSCVDVLYDLAFLLMDLWRRRLPRHANAAMNAYLLESPDMSGLSLLPLFLSCRAAVRAKTSVTAAQKETSPRRIEELGAQAREYVALAGKLLEPPEPRLIAIGGFSGSGKSTLSLGLAPAIGAVPGSVVLRTDEVRKRLIGVESHAPLAPAAYTAHVSQMVYGRLAHRAAAALRSGHSVIVDGVFARSHDRAVMGDVAADAGVPFCGIWLHADETVLLARVASRRGDASDAKADIVRAQLAQGAGRIEWCRLDANRPSDMVRQEAETVAQRSAPVRFFTTASDMA